MAKNITLSVDDELLAKARRYAAERNTTVNALVREALASLAARAERADKAWDELFAETDASGAEVGPVTWTRDDLHDR